MHTHFFIFFTFFTFLFFLFIIIIIIIIGLGPAQPTWAGLDLAQPSPAGHWPKPVTRLG
jgi:hypothetical protein